MDDIGQACRTVAAAPNDKAMATLAIGLRWPGAPYHLRPYKSIALASPLHACSGAAAA
jgi:hypothetical protein